MTKAIEISKPTFVVNHSVEVLRTERREKRVQELIDIQEDMLELQKERQELFSQLSENHKKESDLMIARRLIELESSYVLGLS